MTPGVSPLTQFRDPFDTGQVDAVIYNSEGDPIGYESGRAGTVPWRRNIGQIWDSLDPSLSPVQKYEAVLDKTQNFGTLETAQYAMQTGRITESELFESGRFIQWNQHNVARGNTFATNELPKLVQGAILGAFAYGAAAAAGVAGGSAAAAEGGAASVGTAEAVSVGVEVGGVGASASGVGSSAIASTGASSATSAISPLAQFSAIPGVKEVAGSVGSSLLSRIQRAIVGESASSPTTPGISPTGVQSPYAMRAPGFVSPQAIQRADENSSMIWFAVLAAIAFIVLLFAKGK